MTTLLVVCVIGGLLALAYYVLRDLTRWPDE